jgi:hypothetical protein
MAFPKVVSTPWRPKLTENRSSVAVRRRQRKPSKTLTASPPNLTVSLETLYHHLPLGLALSKMPEDMFLLRII